MFQVLCVLLCGPVVRPGCPKNSATPTPRRQLARSDRLGPYSDEVINTVSSNTVIKTDHCYKPVLLGVGVCAREQWHHDADAADTDQGETLRH